MARRNDEAERADDEDLLLVGRMGRAHGVRGEIKMIPLTDDPERLGDIDVLFVGKETGSAASFPVESVRFQQGARGITVLLKLKPVHLRDEAERFQGSLVFARRTDLPALEEDEFFLHDLQGLAVESEDGEPIGTVAEVLDLPGQQVLVVSRPGAPGVMIPAVPEFIKDVDLDAGRIVVQVIEGLLE